MSRGAVGIKSASCFVGGLVLAAAFPPADLGPLAFIALTPLLYAWRGASSRRAALDGLLFGLGFFGVLLEWSRYFGVVAIAPLVLAQAMFIAGAGVAVALMARRGVGSCWLVAAVWVLVEALRARFPLGGFPWGEVGVSLHDFPPARALASVGGVPAVSFVVVACNALVVDLAVSMRSRVKRAAAFAVGGVAALVITVGAVDVTRFQPRVTGSIRFALLQGNDQDRKLTATEVGDQYLTHRHFALARKLRGRYDLIVFPESALERDPTRHAALREQLLAVGRAHGAVVVANARVGTGDGGLWNANLAYEPTGRLEGIYAKQHLVPFGEYVPLRDELSFIGELDQVPYDFTAGHRRVLFHVAHHRFATVICFESAFAPLVRADVRDGAQFVVVTTNNRSYRRSGLAAQHLALSQMRAAETARSVLHASISGISGVVDPYGEVHDTSNLFVNTITSGSIPTTTGETLYVRFGDWVVLLAGLLLAISVFSAVLRHPDRRPRTAAVDSE